MVRYVLHVGPQKTGTTYLQTAFTQFREDLLKRGIAYPGNWGSIHGQYPLVDRIGEGIDQTLREEFAALNQSDLDIVLLSSETFLTLSDDGLRGLRELMGGAPVTVVYFCRRWSEVIRSAWREGVKHGQSLTFPEFICRYVLNPRQSIVVDYGMTLDRYAAIFGKQNMRVASYNHIQDANVDLFQHFCQMFLDWPDPPVPAEQKVNESLSLLDSETLRALNALEWHMPPARRTRLVHRYLAMKPTLPLNTVADLIRKSVLSVEIMETSIAFRSLHDEIMQRYGDAIVPPGPAGRLFESADVSLPYVHTSYLMHPGILQTLRQVHATLKASPEP